MDTLNVSNFNLNKFRKAGIAKPKRKKEKFAKEEAYSPAKPSTQGVFPRFGVLNGQRCSRAHFSQNFILWCLRMRSGKSVTLMHT
jgi:hypothetical protein